MKRIGPLQAWLIGAAILVRAPAGLGADPFADGIRPLLERYCFECHDADSRKGGVDLARYETERSIHLDPKRWETVARLIRDREMPPPKKAQPTPEERERLVDGLTRSLQAMDFSLIPKDPGQRVLQRLGRLEYNNTVRDLFGVDLRPADKFPADGSGGGGFDNNAGALFLPPILMEKYLAAATEVLAAAPASRLYLHRPGYLRSERAAASATLRDHARRAFRGFVSDDEVDRLLSLYDQVRTDGGDWEAGVRSALKAVLVSPRFLYRVEAEGPGSGPHPISDFELATRLSYFLWASTPDDELLGLAEAGRLGEPAVLRRQIGRLLADPRADAFAEDFVTQWLGVRRLRHGTAPDPRKFPEFTPGLRDAMIEEPVRFFVTLVREDRPLAELLDANYTFVNADLARVYGLSEIPDEGWHRVPLPDRRRGGVVTMPAVLTVSSYPQRTSPVLRGKWILEEILGAPPLPPPPNAGGLPPDDRPKEGLTFRQRLEKHRTKPECAACHARMDPLGFGLENYDPMGRWRDAIGEVPVDASGSFNTGETFDGPAALKDLLLARRKEFIRNLTEKLLSYALGRGLEYFDAPTVRALTDSLEREGYRSRVLIEGIAESYPFRHRRSAAVQLAGP